MSDAPTRLIAELRAECKRAVNTATTVSERYRAELVGRAAEALEAASREQAELYAAILPTEPPHPFTQREYVLLAQCHQSDSEIVDREVEKREEAEARLRAVEASAINPTIKDLICPD